MMSYIPGRSSAMQAANGPSFFHIPDAMLPKSFKSAREGYTTKFPAVYKTRPNPARATATRPPATSKPAAPLPELEPLEAVALAEEEPVEEPVAKPVWTAVSEEVVAVGLVRGTVDVADAETAKVLLVEGYADAAAQYCSRSCWTEVTPGSLGQLL